MTKNWLQIFFRTFHDLIIYKCSKYIRNINVKTRGNCNMTSLRYKKVFYQLEQKKITAKYPYSNYQNFVRN